MENYQTITIEKSSKGKGIYILTLNRPKSMNAMNTQMGIELIEILKALNYKEDCRALLITAAGDRAFCTGADLKERNGMNQDDWKKQHDIFEEVTRMIREFPMPVLCYINGYALGGGFELALSCDMRVSESYANLGFPEAKIGILPGIGGSQLITRMAPLGIAKELLFSGRQITAEEALSIGLVNEVVRDINGMERSLEILGTIAKNAPIALRQIKKAVNAGMQTDLTTALQIELMAYYTCANSKDRLEGIQAFNEKREPVWSGK